MQRISLAAGFLFFSLNGYCQDRGDTLRELEEFSRSNIEKLRELHYTKSVSPSLECENFRPKEAIQSILDFYGDSAGILIYSFSRDTLRTWLCRNGSSGMKAFFYRQDITREKLISTEIELRSALRVDSLSEGRSVIKRSGRQPLKSEGYRKALDSSIRSATEILLPLPIAGHLSGLRHLIVIPELNVAQFPFYLLRPFNNAAYLIDSLSVAIGPHLCNFAAFIEKHQQHIAWQGFFRSPLIVGNPTYNTGGDYILPQLAGAEKEALHIDSLLRAKNMAPLLFVNKDAKISDVVKASKNADLLYFATHGYFDFEKLLDSSFLAFSPDRTNKTGLWTARGIQSEKLTGSNIMAVLSACQTGVGKVYDGGFIGIGRAFYMAGVDHTIMSLWSVNDDATYKLMSSFMNKVVNEPRLFYPAEHLRRAIIEFKENSADPALWAPFMLFGFPK